MPAAAINKFPLPSLIVLAATTVVILPNTTSGVNVNGLTMTTVLETATPGSEDSSVTFGLLRGGAVVSAVKMSGKSAAGQFPLEILATGSGLQTIGLTDAGSDQEIVKTGGSRAMGFGTASSGIVYMYANSVASVVCLGSSGQSDVSLGNNVALANNATNGFGYLPQSETTGVPTGTPTQYGSGLFNHKAPFFINKIDFKGWAYFGASGWKSVTFA